MSPYWYHEENMNQITGRSIKIDPSSHVAIKSFLDRNPNGSIEIGKDCTICEGTYILVHDASTKVVGLPGRFGKVKIGNNVFIGINCNILMDTTIGDNVIIGAGSTISGNIPSNEVWGGCPAKFIKSIEDFKIANK